MLPTFPQRAHAENRLIAALPVAARRGLLARCEQVQLAAAAVLCEADAVISHAYFPIDCLLTLVACTSGGARLEVDLVGDEGMLGITLMLGVGFTPLQWRVQGAGLAWRIKSAHLLGELASSPALRRELEHYLFVAMAHLARNAACLRFHVVETRLARWLLEVRDRLHSDSLHVTHENLAHSMGVRRAGITRAASTLQHRGLISYSRGDLQIVDGPGLEAACCDCYAANRLIHANVMELANSGRATASRSRLDPAMKA